MTAYKPLIMHVCKVVINGIPVVKKSLVGDEFIRARKELCAIKLIYARWNEVMRAWN